MSRKINLSRRGGRHKCKCDPGYVGLSCLPICDLKPCKNNGTCILNLDSPKSYTCKCDERFYRGRTCEEVLDLSCPSTWWNWPDCAPCSCSAEKNFSPECHKKSGQCKCKVRLMNWICSLLKTVLTVICFF